MYITRDEMINTVMCDFEEYGYKSAISKRLAENCNSTKFINIECMSLNGIVRNLDSKMLNEVYFDSYMNIDKFDKFICRLLYVSGNWRELCYYQLLINDMSDLFYANICYESETLINVIFATKDSNIGMVVDDQKVGIKMVRTISMEKEF